MGTIVMSDAAEGSGVDWKASYFEALARVEKLEAALSTLALKAEGGTEVRDLILFARAA